jgi:TrmH family RNA methyltransferase
MIFLNEMALLQIISTLEMCMEKITSKTNNIIKDTKRLFSSSKSRHEQNLFVLEGARLCFDVLNSLYSVDTVLYTEELYAKYSDKVDSLVKISDRAYVITKEIADKLSDTTNPQGIFVVAKIMDTSREITRGKIIALDNVQDPSNVGAIIRSAEALGIDGIITYNSCDIFNPKTIRATMGSILRMNIIDTENLEDCLSSLKGNGFKIYATVPDSNADKINDVDFSSDVVCVIGNEANGVEENIKSIADRMITIPMLGRAESLNASVAGAITMWEMVR